MKLSPICQKAYERWIDVETWHTSHPLDKRRFYGFVNAYLQYARKEIGEENLRRDIVNRYAGNLEANFLETKAKYYAYLFGELVQFTRATKR